MVLSLAAGGDLWCLLEERNKEVGSEEGVGLEELLVRRWCAEIVDAVGWLHGCGWAHRFVLCIWEN